MNKSEATLYNYFHSTIGPSEPRGVNEASVMGDASIRDMCPGSWPADWLVPDWPVPPNVRAVCTARTGGASEPPYGSLNLGDHVGDAPVRVAYNRAALRSALGARPVFLRQVHGTQAVTLSAATPDDAQGDAAITTMRGLACTVMVADCLPVLFTDTRGRMVAAAHAGWRGLAGVGSGVQIDAGARGVLESVYEFFKDLSPVENEKSAIKNINDETLVWLGPCIGPQAFEVGAEVRAAFVTHDLRAASLFRLHGDGKYLADLAGLARQRLNAMGITRIYGNDSTAPWCTVSNPSRFFSHRRDRLSGRFAACVWKD